MKKTFTVILILLFSNSVIYSQFLDTKINLNISAGISKSLGNKDVTEGNFIVPSLFANFDKGSNFNFRATYKLKPYISFGLQFKNTRFSEWKNNNSSLYDGSKSVIQSFGPVIKLHTKYKTENFFNKFSASLFVVPTFNSVNVKLAKSIYDVQGSTPTDDLINSEISSFGAELNLNFEYTVSQYFALFVESGANYLPLESKLYNDSKLLYFNINFGLTIIVLKNKHYYYN